MLPVLHPSFYAAYCNDAETDLLTRSIKKELAEDSKPSSHQQQQQQQHHQQQQKQHQNHERRQRMSMTKKGLLLLLFVGTIGMMNVLCMAGTNGDNILEYLEWDEYIYPLLNLPLNHHICFVTAQYMSSKTDADNLVNLHKEAPRLVPPAPNDKKGRKKKRRQSEYKERQKSYLHFFAFTNRHDLIATDKDGGAAAAAGTPTTTDVNANGWTVIVQEFPQFHRFITQSRWPKFQGYKHPRLGICEVIFYMDGTVLPVGTPAKFQAEARRILDSDVKLSQEIHPKGGGIEGEMERCRLKNKDVEDNLQASLEWLKAQPDYTNDCVLYQNTFFGYANPNYVGNSISNDMMGKNTLRRNLDNKQTNQQQPSSSFSSQMLSQVPPPPPRHRSSSTSTSTSNMAIPPPSPFAIAADFLWDRFSKEVDSWRDQPLWCYVLHHFHIQPLVIPNRLFLYQGNRRPANDHTYGIEAATAAKVYYDERGKGSSDTTADEDLATSEGGIDPKSKEDGTTTTTTDTITTTGALG